jgi:SAM-dependent methyltransferase
MQSYTNDFYQIVQEGSRQSAKEIIPLVIELIKPESVIDIGCGVGTWLSVFKEYGIEDVLGVDGDYVDKKLLEIPEERFLTFDLKKPFRLDRQFDLVISLEVAEHLPQERAETFVDSLTRLGSVILFSAAIPFQGGTEHLNEQWLDYWAKYFIEKGYVAIDCIRDRVWQNDKVEFWYAQNILVFARRECLDLEKFNLLRKSFEKTSISQISLVHPKKYLELAEKYLQEVKVAEWYIAEAEKYAAEAEPKNMSLKKVISALPTIIRNSLKIKLFQK